MATHRILHSGPGTQILVSSVIRDKIFVAVTGSLWVLRSVCGTPEDGLPASEGPSAAEMGQFVNQPHSKIGWAHLTFSQSLSPN